MILPGCSIQFSVIYAHPPSCHSSYRNQFIPFIFYQGESTLFGNHMNWAHPRIVDIAKIKPAFNHFNTSFLTTFFITGFCLLWCSIEDFALSSSRILCMQIEGLIPLRSSIDQAIVSLYFLRIFNNLCSSFSVNAADIITGFAVSGSKKAFFR